LFSTRADGPVIILSTADAVAADTARARALEGAGARVVAVPEAGIEAALRQLPPLGVHSLLVEGGTALHGAVWDAGVVDYVQLYVAPAPLGGSGVPIAADAFSTVGLFDRRVTALGPDVLIEGYVHRPH
jgi:riboflavin biosynthesis pyrimidine reductase